MKKMILSLALLSLAACAPASDNKSSGPANAAGGLSGGGVEGLSAPITNDTDYSLCGSANSNRTNIEGGWKLSQSQGDFKFTVMLEFSNGRLLLQNTCSYYGRTLRAEVTAFADYGQGILEVLSSARDEKRMDDNGFKMTCDVDVQPMRLNYEFKGRCLVLTQSGNSEKLVLAPL